MTNQRVWEFDRYVDGQLKAEGIRVSKADSQEQAFVKAVRMASPGSVLVLRSAAEPTADAKDAARYRWLRKENSQIAGPAAYSTYPEHGPLFERELDAALDEAISAENREQQ